MITMELNNAERAQFPYVLPAQGSMKTLELVTSILEKITFETDEEARCEDAVTIEFEDEEIELMKLSIRTLDEAQRLSLQSLSLAKKILRSN